MMRTWMRRSLTGLLVAWLPFYLVVTHGVHNAFQLILFSVTVHTVVMCQVLLNPPNAIVQHPSGVEYLSAAEYSCNTGFTRASGDTERTCEATGTWSGSELVCDREFIHSCNIVVVTLVVHRSSHIDNHGLGEVCMTSVLMPIVTMGS